MSGSVRIGWGSESKGTRAVAIYRATQELACVLAYPGCHGIRTGDLFTRTGYAGGGMRRAPACGACEPFVFEEGP